MKKNRKIKMSLLALFLFAISFGLYMSESRAADSGSQSYGIWLYNENDVLIGAECPAPGYVYCWVDTRDPLLRW